MWTTIAPPPLLFIITITENRLIVQQQRSLECAPAAASGVRPFVPFTQKTPLQWPAQHNKKQQQYEPASLLLFNGNKANQSMK